jgi:hypothetical protein
MTTDPILIGLIGRAGAGKSTAADYLVSRYGFVSVAFADSLKHLLAEHLVNRGLDYAHLYEPNLKEQPIVRIGHSAREMMQRVGDCMRAMDPDYWVHALADTLGMRGNRRSHWAPLHDRIVVPDVRYPNEADWVRAAGGTLMRIQRDSLAPVREHSSEQHADTLPAHHVLNNTGCTPAWLQHQLDVLAVHCGWDVRPPVELGV